MNQYTNFPHTGTPRPKRRLFLRRLGAELLAACLLLTGAGSLFASCAPAGRPGQPDTEQSTEKDVTEPAISEGGILTLAPETTPASPDEPAAPLPLDPAADYGALVITSVYAAGIVAGHAQNEASYIELYNGSDQPLPLAGLAVYLSARGNPLTEYRFAEAAAVPARGHFLIRGADARGTGGHVLSLTHSDASLPAILDAARLRVAIAPAGQTFPTDQPMAAWTADRSADGAGERLFTYVSADPVDAADRLHYVDDPTADDVVRKEARSDAVPYQTIRLTDSPTAFLRQIRPKTAAGDVNTAVASCLDEVIFSHESGVYTEAFDLTMTAPEGYTIYYSINDTDPCAMGRPLTYAHPLHLHETDSVGWGHLTAGLTADMGMPYAPVTAGQPGAAVVKAFAVRESDGAVTPMTTHTYLIGSTFADWQVDIVSVSVNTEQFIGAKGIYSNIQNRGPGQRPHIPAYVEFFAPDGTSVHAGRCELAMTGKGSLGMTQKSFRILLKSDIMDETDGPENLKMLDYDLYGQYASRTPDGERVTWYRRVLLRNGGGDMSGSPISRSHIGDAYIQRLDRFLRPDVMAYAPVMTFVNGEFFGMFNARDRMDSKYFEGKYGVPESDFAMLECPYPLTFGWNVDYTATYGDPAEATAFMDLVRFAQEHDLSVPENYRYIEEKVDLDGLIDFFCAQIYLCCSDWPSNNIKVWRSTNPAGNVDTKWHFCIVDTDHGVGLNSRPDTDLWGAVSDVSVIGRLINHLCDNPAFRDRFQMRYVWCIEVYFTPDRMKGELDELLRPIDPLMHYQLDRWRQTNGTPTTYADWSHFIQVIRDFADERPACAKRQFQSFWHLDDADYDRLRTRAVQTFGTSIG